MAGYNLITKLRRIEEQLDKLGFMLCSPRHGMSHGGEYRDMLALKPKDIESLPLYTRDAEIFCGTLDELERWIQGVNWARDYDGMLFGKKHDGNRERKEQDVRNRRLVNILKQEETNLKEE